MEDTLIAVGVVILVLLIIGFFLRMLTSQDKTKVTKVTQVVGPSTMSLRSQFQVGKTS